MATYEHSTTITSSQSSEDGIGWDGVYFRSLNGILKIVEVILDIIALICTSVWLSSTYYYVIQGTGYVEFVTTYAFIITLILYIFHLFRIIDKLPGPWGLIELIYYALCSLKLLIAGILAAVRAVAVRYSVWYEYTDTGAIGATAFFTFVAFGVYCVDTFFLFRGWRSSRKAARETDAPTATTAAATTTATTAAAAAAAATTTTTTHSTNLVYTCRLL